MLESEAQTKDLYRSGEVYASQRFYLNPDLVDCIKNLNGIFNFVNQTWAYGS